MMNPEEEQAHYAPPPSPPARLIEMRSKLKQRNQIRELRSLPDFDQIAHSGSCLLRVTAREWLLKRWSPAYWISQGNQILFFRSRDDFEECFTNPYLAASERQGLVKFCVTFPRNGVAPYEVGFDVKEKKDKYYKRENGLVHQFKLEKYFKFGPNIRAAVGSKSQHDLDALYWVMSELSSGNDSNLGKGMNQGTEIIFDEEYGADKMDFNGRSTFSTFNSVNSDHGTPEPTPAPAPTLQEVNLIDW